MKNFLDSNVKLSVDSKAPPDNNYSSNNVETNRLTRAVPSKGDLDGLSLRDLIHLEQQFHGYLRRVRAKKEDLLLEQLGDLKEQVTKAPRSTNGNSSTLEKSVDSGLSETIGSQNSESQGDCEHCCPQEAPPSDGSPSLCFCRADGSEQTDACNQAL